MKKLQLSALCILFLLPVVASADRPSGKLSTNVWYLDTTVMINGSDLAGQNTAENKLCFAPEADPDDLRCFTAGHPNITKWTNSNITFVPPKNTPPAGLVILIKPTYKYECKVIFREQQCDVKRDKVTSTIANYKAHPYIQTVINVETGQEVSRLDVDTTYEIQGYRFGDYGRSLQLGSYGVARTDIQRWTHDSIIFTPTTIQEDVTKLHVNNGSGIGNAWRLPDQFVKGYTEVKTRSRGVVRIPKKIEQSIASVTEGYIPQPAYGGSYTASGVIFNDITAEHPYYNAIMWAESQGAVSGFPDGEFKPEVAINRVALLKILMEADPPAIEDIIFAETQFSDVDPEAWYAPYVLYAEAIGLVDGYEDGTFRPEQTVNTAEAMKIIYRYFHIATPDPLEDQWYARYLEHAEQNSIFYGNQYDVDADLLRQDVVWILLMLYEKGFLA